MERRGPAWNEEGHREDAETADSSRPSRERATGENRISPRTRSRTRGDDGKGPAESKKFKIHSVKKIDMSVGLIFESKQ
jgi:hypothetical protein